ncbi:MAG: WD40 repeat domain-containing protein [bacterium]
MKVIKVLKCHSDVISSIAIIENEKAFATSSFDCCVHIWSIVSFNKLGSLILA